MSATAKFSWQPLRVRGAVNGVWVLVFLLAFSVSLLISGCTVGPTYRRPEVSIPATYKEIPPGWKIAQPADTIDRGPWWTVYDDGVLNTLIDKVNHSNQTITQYAAAYRRARAQVSEARAAYFPKVGLSADIGRSSTGQSAMHRMPQGTVPQATQSSMHHKHNIQLEASWEIDLWGKVDHMVRAKQASVVAAAADLANTRLSVQALLAQSYFQLRMSDAIQKILDDTVVLHRESLNLTKTQFQQGAIDYSAVILVQTQLQQAQVAALDSGITRARYEHAIATLIGEPASVFSLPPRSALSHLSSVSSSFPFRAPPPLLPLELPSVWLERRPDIAAAERRVAVANEEVGVATAALFPTFSLSVAGGFQNPVWSQLLTLPSRFWSVGSQVTALLFDKNANAAKQKAARALYDQEVALYRATVLSAFQDIEDNLATHRILEQEMLVQKQIMASAERAFAISTAQFKAGQENYLKVLNAQTTLLTARQRLTTIAGQQMVASVNLVKALGGGPQR